MLTRALVDPAATVRHEAVRGARKLAPETAIPALLRALKDPSDGIRFGAAQSLGFFPRETAQFLPVLEDVRVSDPAASVRDEAGRTVEALKRGGHRRQ